MYYLTVRNLGVERCIHRSDEDIYAEGMSYDCSEDLGLPQGNFLREVPIRCTELPGEGPLMARVYGDP